jgi:hypothetical protein
LIGFTPIDEQAGIISQEAYKILKRFFIGVEFGVVAAAIQRNVDCEDYLSHLIPFKFLSVTRHYLLPADGADF